MVQTHSVTEPLIICGATCVGKSQTANKIASILGGEIVGADSMQIYKKLNIGTAKTAPDEMLVPHYMIDIIEPNCEYSVAEYRENATKIIADIQGRTKTPVIVGGTGLYINSIIYNYDFNNCARDEKKRAEYSEFLEKNGKQALFELLKVKDVEAYNRLHINDTKRIIRALEIADLGGTTAAKQTLNANYAIIGLNIDRAILYEKINKRVEQMFIDGLCEEVKAISDKIGFDVQAMQAIGYKEFKAYFDGQYGLVELKELIKQHTRNYAKRQITWFKSLPNIIWCEPKDAVAVALKLYGREQ